MRSIRGGKRRTNQENIERLQNIYPRAQVLTWYDKELKERTWYAEFKRRDDVTVPIYADRVQDLERELHRVYPYIRGEEK